MNNADVTPAMRSTIRVLNLLTNSAGFDTGKVHIITTGGFGGSISRKVLVYPKSAGIPSSHVP